MLPSRRLTRFDRHPEYHGAALHGQELWLLVQRLDQGPARAHIDIHTDDLPAEIARLEELGAERVQQVHSLPYGCAGWSQVGGDGPLADLLG